VAREARRRGLSVVVFTGYALEELRGGAVPGADALLAETDVLVDGRYERDEPETRRRWVGSANQRFHFLTARYRPGLEMARSGEPERTVELRVGPDGRTHASGWPEW
jgi:anaerobic ribonucleoside-triphosphate reductase activating protein